jgi:hypothetical protein
MIFVLYIECVRGLTMTAGSSGQAMNSNTLFAPAISVVNEIKHDFLGFVLRAFRP